MTRQYVTRQIGKVGLLLARELERLWKVEEAEIQLRASAAELFASLNKTLEDAVYELTTMAAEYGELKLEVARIVEKFTDEDVRRFFGGDGKRRKPKG